MNKAVEDDAYISALMEASEKLSLRHSFAYYDHDDIRQELFIIGLDAYKNYDRSRKPLPFVYKHLTNRLRNMYRNIVHRSDAPCLLCHEGRHSEHENGEVCKAYLEWKGRNALKANLACPADLSLVSDNNVLNADDLEGEAGLKDLKALLDEHLPANLRADYLRVIDGARLKPVRRQAVRDAVYAILAEHAPSLIATFSLVTDSSGIQITETGSSGTQTAETSSSCV